MYLPLTDRLVSSSGKTSKVRGIRSPETAIADHQLTQHTVAGNILVRICEVSALLLSLSVLKLLVVRLLWYQQMVYGCPVVVVFQDPVDENQ